MKIRISDITQIYTKCDSEEYIMFIFKNAQNRYITTIRFPNAFFIHCDDINITIPHSEIIVMAGKVKIGDITIEFPNCDAIAEVENAFREMDMWKRRYR